jgi:hypothetical protein
VGNDHHRSSVRATVSDCGAGLPGYGWADIKWRGEVSDQQLKVWWIPQVPGKAFEMPVASIEEAKKIS